MVRKSRRASLKRRYTSKKGGGRHHNETKIPRTEWKALDEWLDSMKGEGLDDAAKKTKAIINQYRKDYKEFYGDEISEYDAQITFYLIKRSRGKSQAELDYDAYIFKRVFAKEGKDKMPLLAAIQEADTLDFSYA
jgi:hypothetical protein